MNKINYLNLNQNYIILIMIIISFLTTFILKDSLQNNLVLGNHVLVLFFPFFYFSIYQIYFNKKNFNIFFFIIFIFISFLPIINFFFNAIYLIEGDDSYDYLKYSHYIIDNLTLTFGKDNLPYIRQPGSGYFYAIELFFFKNENRLLQITNLIIYFSTLFYFIKSYEDNNFNYKILNFLLLLSIPYSIKSILSFYPGWIIILFSLWSYFLYLKKQYTLMIIFISFIPFIRQNLIFVSLFICFLINYKIYLKKRKIKYRLIFVYLFILMLPIYHNYYYANSLKFFVQYIPDETIINLPNNKNIQWAVFLNNLTNFEIPNINFYYAIKEQIYMRLKNFLLINMPLKNSLISLFVIPSLLFIFYLIFVTKFISKKITLFLFFLLIYIPTLVGSGNYPRFEFMTFYCFIIFFLSIHNNKKSRKINLTPKRKEIK